MEIAYAKLTSWRLDYFPFKGSVGALTKAQPLYANAGETAHIFFGVVRPNSRLGDSHCGLSSSSSRTRSAAPSRSSY